MKAVLALTATFAVANAALMPRQLDQIPSCALSCALSSLGSTGCAQTDFACICKANSFITALVPCVQGACSAAEYENTVKAAQGLCSAAGVTLSIPSGAVSTSAESSSAATSAPATTSAATETSAATTSAASSEATTSVVESSTGAVTTSSVTSVAPTSSTGNSTISGTAPPQPTGTEPGAASRNTVALGGLGAIVALVAAFL
jgi:hypothetical protein